MTFKRYFNGKTLVLLLSLITATAAYWHDLTVLLDDALKNEMASYILALPFLTTYLVLRNRKSLKAQLSLETGKSQNAMFKDIVGAALCVSALFLYLYGSFTFNALEYHIASLIIFIMGCSVFLLGIRNLRNMVFPIGFLLLLIIPYREEAYQASVQLSTLTSTITFSILEFLGYPVSVSTLYDAPSILVQTASGEQIPFVIDIPCAGAYSLIGFLVFALFFAYISRGSPLKKAVWLILGFSIIYAANLARVSCVLMIGYWFGLETAMGLFHLFSGSLLIFTSSILMIVVGEKSLKISLLRRQTGPDETCSLCGENKATNQSFCDFCGRFLNASNTAPSKMDFAKILALSLMFATLTNVQVPAFALTSQNLMEMDIHETTGSKETLRFLPLIKGYEPRFLYRDQRFEGIAQQDASLLYVYSPQNSYKAPIFLSVEIADSYSKLHRWEVCLYVVPEQQGIQTVDPILSKDVSILENPQLTARLFVFQYVRSKQTTLILYWYQKAAFKIGGAWGNRYVKTSLIAYLDTFVRTGEITSVNDYADVENNVTSVAQAIIEYWQPAKEWTAYTVAFAQHGQTLSIAAVLAGSSLVTVLFLKDKREEGNRALSVYKQLIWHSTFSEKEKKILKVLDVLSESGGATGREVASTYEERTGEKINSEELADILRYAEDYSLVRTGIATREEKPVLTWRPTTAFNI